MTLKVRDEADIIEDNLRYHRAQGVDFFVVADTGSTDGTVQIIEPYEAAGMVRLERIGRGIHDMKEGGEGEIARIAGEMGADWVIHNDADEFWWPLTGNLKEAIAVIPDRYGLVVAPRTEFVARPGNGQFAERLTIR
jgi:glycosyltransferase involved in cell wall biosynthesis